MFFEIGLAVTFVIIFISFQWTVKVHEVQEVSGLEDLKYEEEMVPITHQEAPKEAPALPPKIRPMDVITIVDDEAEIEQELEVVDVEADQDTKIEVQEPMVVEEEEEAVDETQIFVVVEEMPVFRPEICKTQKEGDVELYKYIYSHIKYPAIAQENGITGRVYVRFIVAKDGSVKNVQVMRGVDPSLDNEAIRVISNLPKFSPGKQRGIPVQVSYTAVINFVLQ